MNDCYYHYSESSLWLLNNENFICRLKKIQEKKKQNRAKKELELAQKGIEGKHNQYDVSSLAKFLCSRPVAQSV